MPDLLAIVSKPSPHPVNLAAHEDRSPLPCLCKHCLPAAPEAIECQGSDFLRTKVELHERVLWFWLPASLSDELEAVQAAVTARLQRLIQPFPVRADASPTDEAQEADDDCED